MIAWDTDWRAVDRNRAEAVLSDCDRFIVASLVLPLILRCFFSTLGDVLTSFKLGVTTMYVLMGFIELLSTISWNTGSSSESNEYRSLYPLEVGVGAARFGIRRTVLAIGYGGTVESIVVFEIEGEWTCLVEMWLGEESSDTCLATGLLTRAWYVIRWNLVLNRSTILSEAVTSFQQMYPCLANAGHPNYWWNFGFRESSG